MHSHSIASGLAIARLVDNPDDPHLAQEAADFVEHARTRLALDNSAVTCAMMFSQPLIKMWVPHWKFAYTVGLAMGVKFTTEGFFLIDILEHVTQEFTLECLKAGEALALELFDWTSMNQRCRDFRNALVSVALESPPSARRPVPNMPTQFGPPPIEHVLIVDDSQIVRDLHEQLVLQIRPGAHVHCTESVADAVAYVQQSDERDDPVRLILLDLNLSLPDASSTRLEDIFGSPNGFDVAFALDEAESPDNAPAQDFRFKPFVAMVSYLADTVTEQGMVDGMVKPDGSVRGCDALLPKPLTLDSLRVLIEGCGV